MVGSDIDGYTARFHKLARLVPHMVTPKNQRVNRYIWGLAPEIKEHVTSSKPATIQGVMYGQPFDHRWRNCPRMNRATTIGGNYPNPMLAIKGNSNLRNNRNRAQGRAFGLEYCPDDEVHMLELEFWNHKMVGSDIDGYTARFHKLARLVPHMVTPKNQRVNRYIWGLAPEIKEHVTSSKPATIQGVMYGQPFDHRDPNHFRRNYPRMNRATTIGGNYPNPMLAMKGNSNLRNNRNRAQGRAFGLGMDWLSKLRAKIVYFEKSVQIPLSNGDIFEVHGERPEGNLKQLNTMKVNESKLKDTPIVHDFLDVFLKDLSGLLPYREVEFCIELIPGAMPVAKSPYRLAPTEMQELSNQFKEL
nr:putative reverse transcriptase domain-containing protein [Tanacetum cinerariifolium]